MVKYPRSAMAESIRHLRTSLMLSVSGGPPEAIVVTSPHPGEGKVHGFLKPGHCLGPGRPPGGDHRLRFEKTAASSGFPAGQCSRPYQLPQRQHQPGGHPQVHRSGQSIPHPGWPDSPKPCRTLEFPDVQKSSASPAAGIRPHHHRHSSHVGVRRRPGGGPCRPMGFSWWPSTSPPAGRQGDWRGSSCPR